MAVRDVLRNHGDQLRSEQLADVIEAVVDCAVHCEACADACLEEGDATLKRCIRADLDCADICVATAKVVGRAGASGAPWLAQLDVCARACAHAAAECAKHQERHEHCRRCVEACRRGEQACRDLLASVE